MRLQRSPNVVNKRYYYLTTSEFGTTGTPVAVAAPVLLGDKRT